MELFKLAQTRVLGEPLGITINYICDEYSNNPHILET